MLPVKGQQCYRQFSTLAALCVGVTGRTAACLPVDINLLVALRAAARLSALVLPAIKCLLDQLGVQLSLLLACDLIREGDTERRQWSGLTASS